MKILFLEMQYSILFMQILLIDAACIRDEVIDEDNANNENWDRWYASEEGIITPKETVKDGSQVNAVI